MSGRGAAWRGRVRALAASGMREADAAAEMGMSCAAFDKASRREFGLTWVEMKRAEATKSAHEARHAASASDLVAIAEERTRRFKGPKR